VKSDYKRFASDIKLFLSEINTLTDRINHWPEIASFVLSERTAPAIGLWATSVGENPFDLLKLGRNGKRDWRRAFDVYKSLTAQGDPHAH